MIHYFVRIGKKAQKALLKYLSFREDELPWLWVTEERTRLARRSFETMMKSLGKAVGITSVRCSPHTLRHTNATLSFLNGARDWEVQELLGHTTETMTKKYRKTLQSAQAVVGHRNFSPVDKMAF